MLTVAPSGSGLATVNVAEGVSPGVVQKIFESVLNGSRYLDVSFHQVSVPKVERCEHVLLKSLGFGKEVTQFVTVTHVLWS